MNEPTLRLPQEWRVMLSGHRMHTGYYTDKEVEYIQLNAITFARHQALTEAVNLVTNTKSNQRNTIKALKRLRDTTK